MMRRLLALLFAVVPGALAGQEGQKVPRPVAPVIRAGGCPFECCRYGEWRTEASVGVRPRPVGSAKVTAWIRGGTPVHADTGFVRVTRVGRVLMPATREDPKTDTLLVLDYIGEGFFHVWYRGEVTETEVDWEKSPRDKTKPRLLVEPRAEWWAHVRWTAGGRRRQGWLWMKEARVRGSDACA